MVSEYNPKRAFLADLRVRYEKLLATSALLHAAETSGQNLGLDRAETLTLAAVMLGEANQRFQELLTDEARRRGTCVVVEAPK